MPVCPSTGFQCPSCIAKLRNHKDVPPHWRQAEHFERTGPRCQAFWAPRRTQEGPDSGGFLAPGLCRKTIQRWQCVWGGSYLLNFLWSNWWMSERLLLLMYLCFLLSFFAWCLVLCLHIFMYPNLGQLKWKSAMDKKTGRQLFGLFSKNFDSLYLYLVEEDFEHATTENLPALGEVIPETTEPWGHWRSMVVQGRSVHTDPECNVQGQAWGLGGSFGGKIQGPMWKSMQPHCGSLHQCNPEPWDLSLCAWSSSCSTTSHDRLLQQLMGLPSLCS